MNIFVLEIWYDEGSICTFYMVRYLDNDHEINSETDQFFDTYTSSEHQFQINGYELFRLITESIANKYGATDDFFDRVENKAQALPPKPKMYVEEIKEMGSQFPLRLFCYRISEQIVVLFNGGIKNAYSAQDSKGLSIRFYEAQAFVRIIEEALRSGCLIITDNERYLKNFDNDDQIIL
jgi:hypothetical protein